MSGKFSPGVPPKGRPMKVKEPVPDFEHGWAETANRFPEDMYLRGHGFEIRYRFRRGPVLWLRNGKLSTHAQAMAEVRAALRRLAKAR